MDAHCELVRRMFAKLAPPRNLSMNQHDPDKHAFDAVRYYVVSKALNELETRLVNRTSRDTLAEIITLRM